MSKHLVSVKKVEELDNGDFNVLIEGYDAEQDRDFNEIITVQEGSFFRGACIDPKRKPLSKGCINLVKVKVMDTLHKRKEGY